jgi:hypothetical protein
VGAAQGLLPDGVFVRDSGGGIWLITGGQRARVPFFPAGDDVIFATNDSGLFVVPAEGGGLTLGGQPDFVNQAPVVMGSAPSTAAAPADPPPSVSISVDDDRVEAGQRIEITVIASDNNGVEWIEWEGTIVDDDDNDNRVTGDPALDGNHRHNCDSSNKQCAFIWQATPTKVGNYTLRARARDNADNRSEWVSIDFRVRESGAPRVTSSPTP